MAEAPPQVQAEAAPAKKNLGGYIAGAPQQMTLGVHVGQHGQHMAEGANGYTPNAKDLAGCHCARDPLGAACGFCCFGPYCAPCVLALGDNMICFDLVVPMCNTGNPGSYSFLGLCGLEFVDGVDGPGTYAGTAQKGDLLRQTGICICEPCCYGVCPCVYDKQRIVAC